MKPNRVLLTAASAIFSAQVMAGQAVFYVTEDGSAVRDLAVSVDGQKKLVSTSGFVVFDIDSGKHTVELSKYGEWMGEFDFSTAASEQNAEVQVEMIAGEAMPEINVYTPGSEEVAVLGQLSGYLQSEETGGPVSGARVSIAGTEQGVMTDEEGFFSFELPRGEYSLVINHPNYGERDVKDVRVMGSVNTGVNLTMSMSGDGMIEEVVAVGTYIPSTATAQERDSSAVLDAIGSEQMARFGDSSAASALNRVAGVSVVGGQYAVVRGMGGRYIASRLNGSPMPSTDPMKRDVPLDLFPASVLGGIDIQKSFTPDMPGDATGGAILMNTKGLPDETMSKASVTLGMNDRTTFSDIGSYQGGDTDYLGYDDGTREMPGFADSLTNGGRDSVNYCGNPNNCLVPGSEEAIDFGTSFENIYDAQTAEAKPERGFSVSTGHLYDSGAGYYGAFQYKDKWTARHDAKLNSSSESGTYERSQRKVDVTGYFVAGIEGNSYDVTSKTILLRKTDDTVKTESVYNDSLDQDVSNVTLQWVERQYLGQQFSGGVYFDGIGTDEVKWRVGVAQTKRDEPDRRSYEFINGNILAGGLERRFSELTEDSFDLGVDYTTEMTLGDTTFLELKAGLDYSNKDRTVDMGRFGIATLDFANADQTGSLEDILDRDAFENGTYGFTTRTTDTDNYKATSETSAGYLSGKIDLGDWSLLAGARYEDFTQELKYPDAGGIKNSLDDDAVLPAVSASYRLNEEWQFRASVTSTVSRPGITERSASVQYDPETDDPLIGNPDLEISDITNFDLRAEYYFSDEESITLAYFNKTVDSPIERTVANGDGNAADGYTFRNEDSADINGIELDFRKNIIDSDSWTGFLSGNISYIDSEVTLEAASAQLEKRSSRELQGQSDYLANIQLGFDHLPSGQSVTFLANYFSDRIYATSRGDIDNEIEDGRVTVDMVYRWDYSDTLVFKGKANNITDAKVSYSQGDNEIESYYTGRNYTATAEYIF